MSKHTVRLEVDSKTIKGLKIGAKIEATIKGVVRELSDRGPQIESPSGAEPMPPDLIIEVMETKIKSNNVFTKLAEEDNEDEG